MTGRSDEVPRALLVLLGADEPEFTDDKDRKCTDVLCLLLFALFWGGMAAIAAIAFAQVVRMLLNCCCLRIGCIWHQCAYWRARVHVEEECVLWCCRSCRSTPCDPPYCDVPSVRALFVW